MSDRVPVIMHITAPAAIGGLERVVHALSAGHAAQGLEVHLVAITDSPTHSEAFLAALGSRRVHTHIVRAPSRAYWRERAAVRSLCENVRPDVVHTHGYRPDVLSAGIANKLGIPTVTTVHGFTGGDFKNRMYEWLQVRAFRRFDAVVAVSDAMATDLARRGVPRDRLHTLVNAWNPRGVPRERSAARRALGLPTEGTVVGWVGRLSREKGADVLLEAFASLTGLDVQLSVVGEGRELSALRAQARSLGLDDRVRWHGAVPEAGQILTAFDVFVLSSRTEGTPIVLFEAMASEVPIVAAAVGGVPNVVTTGEAVLVPSDDSDALAAAIRTVVTDRGASQRRASAALRRLDQKFAVAPWLSAYEHLYRAVMRDGGPLTGQASG